MLLQILWWQKNHEKRKYFVWLCSLAETLVHGPDWAEWKFIVMFLKKQHQSKSLGGHSRWIKTHLDRINHFYPCVSRLKKVIVSYLPRNLHILHLYHATIEFSILCFLLINSFPEKLQNSLKRHHITRISVTFLSPSLTKYVTEIVRSRLYARFFCT